MNDAPFRFVGVEYWKSRRNITRSPLLTNMETDRLEMDSVSDRSVVLTSSRQKILFPISRLELLLLVFYILFTRCEGDSSFYPRTGTLKVRLFSYSEPNETENDLSQRRCRDR